ncbi:MAG: hypothetical protein JW883_10680 [Deltaproteobacteria bacterium]|nr:hypothetical protein [Deltaproteobacteria bacterium]
MVSYKHVYHLANDQLAVIVSKEKERYHVTLTTDIPGPLILHWGVSNHSRHEWLLPPSSIHPAGTVVYQNKAAETTFVEHEDDRRLHIEMSEQDAPTGISFVLKQADSGRWLKDNGRNFFIPVVVSPEGDTLLGDPRVSSLADEIIEKEMSPNSWTLMHRFNLCYDLLDMVTNHVDALALIFVWLRFSAIRQLDWQRNYNTQPRELSHAQDRLTVKLSDRYASEPGEREIIRLILSTMGRGGEGQKVRDEVLNIMHRHHIKEVSGHFMEEWHQKLHNNTTPDDVVICEAYLEFFRCDGDLDVFYKTLEAGGVTKERLESYERPITSHPDFIPHLKEALIHDFGHFLGILKALHSGTDLGTAIHAARYLFDEETHGLMDFIWWHRDDTEIPVRDLVGKVIKARQRVKDKLEGHGDTVRDLLFLDLALEGFLRIVIERNLQSGLDGNELVNLIAMVVESLLISKGDDELTCTLQEWNCLREMPRSFSKEWSLQAKAVLDRLGRALGNIIDQYYRLFQPKAEFLGMAFHADSWTIPLFSEEVVRGSSTFALSMLLRQIDPILRAGAHLGNWQVISPGQGMGRLKVVDALRSVQGKDFTQQTVIVADKIAGDEEIPQGVTALITPDTTDIVSHVAIRARNARVLFATCYDREIIAKLKSFEGRLLNLRVSGAGDIVFKESSGETKAPVRPTLEAHRSMPQPVFTVYAVSASDFNGTNVGGKSNNLKRLKGNLPGWIGLPTSVALPFGVFEKILAHKDNREVSERYEALTQQVSQATEKTRDEALGNLRKTVMALKAPDDLVLALHKVMREAGFALPVNWENALTCIKKVWASKWNERAYLSRRARGIPHEALFMAVLVQEVVEADYSFVIHTVNPLTGNRDEIYAEVVPGLGETLVGNYPGKAFSFTCKKGADEPEILAFPSKSAGLLGSGLIFRSDSSGEDLADYAGAGLYDSVMLEPPRKVLLDYTRELLVCDNAFRKEFLVSISSIGTVVEKALGSPQDIEGAYVNGQYYVVQTRPQVGIESE